jgi:hypothetical protein
MSLGFRKGFLITKKAKSKQDRNINTVPRDTNKRKLNYSSALLDLECDISKSSPFSFLKDDEEEMCHSSYNPDHSDRDSSFGNLSDIAFEGIREVISSGSSAGTSKTTGLHDTSLENEFHEPSRPSQDDYRLISRELRKVLLRRNQKQYSAFVETLLTQSEHWLFTWPIVLQQVPRDSAALELASFMVQTNIKAYQGYETFVKTVEHTSSESNQRTILLGAAMLTRYILNTDSGTIWLTSLLQSDVMQERSQVLISAFIQIVKDSEFRSVIAQEAMITTYGLLSTLLSCNSNFREILETLLQIHEKWLSVGIKKQSWRHLCTLEVLRDWKQVIDDDRAHLFHGVSITGHLENFGGLRQTLFEKRKMDVDDIAAIMKHFETANSEQQENLVRGILAILGQDKSVWKSPCFFQKLVDQLLPLILDAKSEPKGLIIKFLIILLQASPADHISSLVTSIVNSLTGKSEYAKRVGHDWRKSLLESSLVHDSRYTSVLNSICTVMFSYPEEVAPLALIGTLLDGTELSLNRIYPGVLSIAQVCSFQLRKISVQSNTYQRLAPLLLLRRIPSKLFQSLWRQKGALTSEIEHILSDLASQFLSIFQSNDSSPSERKIAAEIVGRSLPLDMEDPNTIFHKILYPVFRDLADQLQEHETENQVITNYRPCKIALYSACCHVSRPIEDMNSPAVMSIAGFALWLLIQHPSSHNDGLADCQLGCMEFLSSCLSNNAATMQIQFQQILLHEVDANKMFNVGIYGITLSNSTELTKIIWTIFLTVSQRKPEIMQWASDTSPWVMKWLSNHDTSTYTVYALQILVVLVTRTKSLECMKNEVTNIHPIIRTFLQHPMKESRLMALRLLMAILLIGLEDKHYASSLFGTEAEETLELLSRMNEHQDEEFQALSTLLTGR